MKGSDLRKHWRYTYLHTKFPFGVEEAILEITRTHLPYEKFHSDISQFEHFEKLKIKTISNKEEEAKIKKEEEELELAETAFDTFLQEKDRLSMEAQKKWSYD